MKVLFDHQAWESQVVGGVSAMHTHLIMEYKSQKLLEPLVALKLSNNMYADKLIGKHGKIRRRIPNRVTREILRIVPRDLRNSYLYPDQSTNIEGAIDALREWDYDVFHPTYYDTYFQSYIGNTPFVVTIYDMIHELYGEFFLKDTVTSAGKRFMVSSASKIVAISETTRNDICDYYDLEENRVSVVYLGSSLENLTDINIPVHEHKRFILYVGARGGYKNFPIVLHAMSRLSGNFQIELLCVGQPLSDDERRLAASLGISSRVRAITPSDEELVSLYRNAVCLVYPSMYEGFGIPVVDAMRFKCPVVLSDNNAFKEIAGEYATYFNPKSVRELEEILDQQIRYGSSQGLLSGAEKHSQKYSWKKSARVMAGLYRDLKNVH